MRHIQIVFIFSTLIGIFSYSLNAQDLNLSPAELKEDYSLFRDVLLSVHPGLNIHLSEEETNSILPPDLNFKTPYPLIDFHRILLSRVVALQDGHSNLIESKKLYTAYPSKGRLPFEFKWIEEKLIISEIHHAVFDFPVYSEITQINGYSVDFIIDSIWSLTPSDGNNESFRKAYNNVILSSRIAWFLRFPEVYQIEGKNPEGEKFELTLDALEVEKIAEAKKKPETPIHFEGNKEANYAILQVNTFQSRKFFEAKIDFHSFLEKAFKTIKKQKIENLIIDVRANYGGDNILAVHLFNYLSKQDFKAMAPSLTRLSGVALPFSSQSNYPDNDFPFLKTNDQQKLDDHWVELSNGIDAKEVYSKDEINLLHKGKTQNIVDIKFDGKIYCLTSGLTFSAGANFTSMLNRRSEVFFIGEPVGGAHGPFCGGGFYSVMLPNSQFILQIPFMKRQVADLKPSDTHVLYPDHPVLESLEDLKQNRDAVLEYAIQLTTNNR